MSLSSKSIPKRALKFREEDVAVGILGLKESKGDGKRKFAMNAHSGKIMLNHWFWGNFAIDLSGISIGRRKKPALREHNSERIVGWTENISIDEKKGVIAEGIFSEKTEDGRQALELADEGFPWQASVYIPPLAIERIGEGEEAEVNGQKLKGPGTIFRKSVLKEVSFCALGADENTSVSALNTKSDNIDLDIEVTETKTKKEVKEMELSGLTLEILKKDKAELAEALLTEGKESGVAEGLKKGVEQERKRVMAILKEAKAFEGMDELAQESIANGDSFEVSLSKLKDKRIAELQAGAPGSAGPNADPNDDESFSSLTGEEKYKAEYKKDAKLAEEFSSEASYVAFRKAEARGAVKIAGSK